jgi:hypothetical protein
MTEELRNIFRDVLMLFVVVMAALTLGPSAFGQTKKPMKVANVDNTNMGAYRALAQLSFKAFDNGDNALAAELARILERTWDKAEEGDGHFALEKINQPLFKEIDDAMDALIKQLIAYPQKEPNRAKVTAAYEKYLIELDLGDKEATGD